MLVLTFRFAQLPCITQKGAYILIWAPVTKTAAQEMPSNHLLLVASGTMLRVLHNCLHSVVVQLLSHVWLCEAMDRSTPGFCPSVSHGVCSYSCSLSRWCCRTISSFATPFSFCLQSFPASGSFPMADSLNQVAKVLELHFQHQSFQWIFRVDFP